MTTKYKIKDKPDKIAYMELKDWEDMLVDYVERANVVDYSLIDWDIIAKNSGYDSAKEQENTFRCVKQYSSGDYPVGSLVVRHKPLHYDSKLNKLTLDVDIYFAEPIK